MAEIEVMAMPILGPLISNTAPRMFSEAEAVTLATLVAKTALRASLLHPDDTNPVSTKNFDELLQRRAPLADAVAWIAAEKRPCDQGLCSWALEDLNL